jgi:HD superfamily phosphohydrolase
MSSANEASDVPKILGWENNIDDDYVLDPIYGPIGLTELESALIKDEVFIRLKNIKQLGFVSHIYPSATHTRFEHSIGTLAITWEMLKRLLRKFEEKNESGASLTHM